MPPGSSPNHADAQAVRDLAAAGERLHQQLGKVIVGRKALIEQLLTALFARGHVLLIAPPGLGKWHLLQCLAKVFQLATRRVQGTPDLTAEDVIGAETAATDPDPGKRRGFLPGPVLTNLLLVDEFDHAPPKLQARLLEIAQEGQVAAAGQVFRLPEPFFLLATRNPEPQPGASPPSAALLDRFLLSLPVEYPTRSDEILVLKAAGGPQPDVSPVLDGKQLVRFQEVVRQAVVADHVFAFATDLVRATRPKEAGSPKFVAELAAWGAGPRAALSLILAGKARAVLAGRFHVTTDDIRAVATPVLRHRIGPSFRAEAEGVTADDIVKKLLDWSTTLTGNGTKSRKT